MSSTRVVISTQKTYAFPLCPYRGNGIRPTSPEPVADMIRAIVGIPIALLAALVLFAADLVGNLCKFPSRLRAR